VVGLLLVALAAYFVLIGYRGLTLLGQSSASLKVLGVAVLVLPLVGIWVVIAELRFGRATERLAHRLDEAPPDLPRTPSGRVDRAAADALFAQCRDAAQAAPEDWRAWFRLAEAYDLAGDRRRARAAMRRAISLAQ
jgi:cytochrome c-type biogenesis protein CcmH/NrfG